MKKDLFTNTEGTFLGSFKPVVLAALTVGLLSPEVLAEQKKKDNNSSRTSGGGYNPLLMNAMHQNNLNSAKTTKSTYFKSASTSVAKTGGSHGG